MPSHVQRPTSGEWSQWKRCIETLYLHENWTLEEVRSLLLSYGFEATARQYKLRLKSWGYDSKKIRGEVWKAMSIVLKHLQPHRVSAQFSVPFRGGGSIRQITPEMVTKQLRRTQVDVRDLAAACEILSQSHVQVALHGAPHDTARCASVFSREFRTLFGMGAPSSPSPPPPPPLPPPVPYSNTLPVLLAKPPRSGPSGAQPYQDCLPFGQVLLPSIQQLVDEMHPYSPTTSSEDLSYSPAGVHLIDTPGASLCTNDVNELNVMAAFLQLAYDQSCKTLFREKLMACAGRTTSVRVHDGLSSDKRIALEWAAYYILQSMPKQDASLIGCDYGRCAARAAFDSMLCRPNRFVFPYCNYIITIVGANEQQELLISFLTDCCQVIDNRRRCGQDLSLTHGSPFHLALALLRNDLPDIEYFGRQLESSHAIIGILWGEEDPNYLVAQYHAAWHKIYRAKYDEAIEILRRSLPKSERIMGYQHTVTINCLAMLSRAHDEKGETALAIRHLNDALYRLGDIAPGLQAYRHRLLGRLGRLLIKAKDGLAAEAALRAVMIFRIDYFGIEAPVTWHTIEALEQFLTNDGKEDEARSLKAEMRALYSQRINALRS